MPEFITQDDQPQMLSDEEDQEFHRKQDKWLSECKKCNHSGYLPGDITCSCMKKSQRKYRLMCSNIPKRYQQVDFSLFRARNDIGFKQIVAYSEKLENARKKGIGLHIYSRKAGTGKTMLAVCVGLEAIRKGYTVWFTSLEELIEDIKVGFKDEKQRRRINWIMFHVDFLILDELSKIQSTEWRDGKVNDLIQRRVNDMLPIISTDNLSIDQLQSKFPEHLISRFSGTQLEIAITHNIEYRREFQKKNLLKELMK